MFIVTGVQTYGAERHAHVRHQAASCRAMHVGWCTHNRSVLHPCPACRPQRRPLCPCRCAKRPVPFPWRVLAPLPRSGLCLQCCAYAAHLALGLLDALHNRNVQCTEPPTAVRSAPLRSLCPHPCTWCPLTPPVTHSPSLSPFSPPAAVLACRTPTAVRSAPHASTSSVRAATRRGTRAGA